MGQLIVNNAESTISTSILAGDTSVTLVDASSFPDPGTDYYLATFIGYDGNGQENSWEIVRVTGKSGSTLTITRAQESTSAQGWASFTPIEARITAGSLSPPDNVAITGGDIDGVAIGANTPVSEVTSSGAVSGSTLSGTLQWSDVANEPTTLAGYGIADAYTEAEVDALTWDFATDITSKPTTVSGYGITDAVTTSGNQTIAGEKTFSDFITAPEYFGDLNGAVRFSAQADEAITKGQAVYITGVSGNTVTVALADANDANKMPAFGLAAATVSISSAVEIVTFGTLSSLDTSTFSAGDNLFVSTTPGVLTDTAPTGESAQIQNVGKVKRSNATVGSIKVGGAGRAATTPNLNDGNIFIGNGSNQAATASLDTEVGAAGYIKDANLTLGSTTATQQPINIDQGTDVTLNSATTSLAGLMAADDKTKLDGVAPSANNYSHPNHTGDVTSTGDGATVIANDAVTYAKMQDVSATNRVLGRDSGGAGIVEEISPSALRTMINVEDGATADQTDGEIKTAYENNANTNAYTDAEQTKVGHLTVTQAVDLDAIETRVNELDASVILMGSWDASSGSFPGGGSAQAGESWIVSVGGTVNSVTFNANDRIIAVTDNASTTTYASNWFKADYTDQVLSVAGKTGTVTLEAADITSGTFANARISQSSVTQHQAALSITESQISDLGSYEVATRQTRTTLSSSDDLDSLANDGWYSWGSSVPSNNPWGSYAVMLQLQDNNQKTQLAFGNSSSGKIAVRRADSGTFYDWSLLGTDASLLDSGTVGDARISQSSVTQHESALSIASSQVTGNFTEDRISLSTNNVLVGRSTAGSGDAEELSATTVRSILNVADGANNYSHPNHTGDVTSSGDGATTLAAAAITGKTALTSGLVATDEFLVSDAGTLKRTDASVLGAYFQSSLVHDGFSDYVSAEHVDHSVVNINAGTGLSGGGAINASRTINIEAAQPTITSLGTLTGLDIDGTITVDTDSGNQPVTFYRTSNASESLQVYVADNAAIFISEQDEAGNYGGFEFVSRHSGTLRDRLKIANSSGDIQFFDTTGATAGLHWDATDSYLGIGLTNPGQKLHVSTNLDYVAKFESTDSFAGIVLEDNSSTPNGNSIAAIGDNIQIRTGGSERVAIDASGIDVTGSIVVSGTVDGRDVASDGSKLDGIAPSANNYSHPNHTGDVTSSGDGATTIANDAVTYAKMQNVSATNRVLGRDSSGAGNVEEISPANLRTMLNVADGANNYSHPNHTGDVTSSGDGATTIANDAVTYAKMQNVSTTDRVLGRDSAGSGNVEEISPASLRTMLNVADGAEVNPSVVSQAEAEAGTASTERTWTAQRVAQAIAAQATGAYTSWNIKTGNYTAVSGDQLICNGASDTTITLPASPSSGDTVVIAVSGAGTVTVGRNGSNINSDAEDGTLFQNTTTQLVYVDGTIGWFEV